MKNSFIAILIIIVSYFMLGGVGHLTAIIRNKENLSQLIWYHPWSVFYGALTIFIISMITFLLILVFGVIKEILDNNNRI